jgi:cob(I)alamin adenosyltransferase
MPIYTKTGDEGKTTLLSGERTTKDCITLRAVGEVDELNASIGVVVAEFRSINKFFQLTKFLQTTQCNLFRIGAELAALQTDLAEKGQIKLVDVLHIKTLEKIMDRITAQLPELNNFILPGGSKAGAYLHRSRTICRRTERVLVSLGKEKEIRKELYMYLNRLSDFLFTVARWVNLKLDEDELKIDRKQRIME